MIKDQSSKTKFIPAGQAEKQLSTRQRIVEESLTLFSRKGFKGTSVKDIADAVHIKDSSLYKHFKSKQEIFDTIIEEMREHMEKMSQNAGLPEEGDEQNAARYYGSLTARQLIDLCREVFLFYLEDPFVSRFWRMANMEQYQNQEVHAIFRQIFMEDSIGYLRGLFGEMMRQGHFTGENPEILAMNFYMPFYFLLSKYNGRPEERTEAVTLLERQIKEFIRIYRIEK